MRLPAVRPLLGAVLLGALGYFGLVGGPLPPLGPLLDPAGGIWALARHAEPPARATAQIAGLGAPVQVLVDDRGVPHIFAASEDDAWRAQGYVVARDRLFQLELQARAAGGTLAELVGARALPADRAARRRGFGWAAERAASELDSASLFARAVRAYADGVNAWIASLKHRDVPLEYRLLGARPSRWEPAHTLQFFLQIAHTLAWDDPAAEREASRALVGARAADALFPADSPVQEPIQPLGGAAPRFDQTPLPPPGPPDSTVLGLPVISTRPPDAVGSNNWAVSPARSVSGHALLAGDPHLQLSLPSVWYEIHLAVQGGPDVAGVTFPGAPGVFIGWNRAVAWSFTNTGADVRDLYLEQVDDPESPSRYFLDGAWRPLTLREEVIRGPRGEILATDTLRITHRGPLVRQGARWLSVRWTVFEARAPGEDFLRLNRAGSAVEWLEAWRGFAGPAQNGVVADTHGTIAIRSTGRFPIRPGDGRGDRIRDGTRSLNDWLGDVPLSDYPFALNPPQGYLASANQQPADPRVNPHYLGASWPSPWRALRINRLLRTAGALRVDDLVKIQTDPGSDRAEALVPPLLAAAAALAASNRGDILLLRSAAILAGWDRRYTRDRHEPVLFENVMLALVPLLWDELIPGALRGDSTARPVAVPGDAMLLTLLADSASAWWDRLDTPARETRDAVLGEAMRRALVRTVAARGPPPPDGDGWRWERVHHVNLNHVLGIPGLSALGLPVDAGPGTIGPSPRGGTHGASWRMVVELGPEITPRVSYPGGQSANPASARYLDRLPRWLDGGLDSVLYPAHAEALPPARVRSRLLLAPAG